MRGGNVLRVRNLLRDWKVDTDSFQETKLDAMFRSVVCSVCGWNHLDWCCLDSGGA